MFKTIHISTLKASTTTVAEDIFGDPFFAFFEDIFKETKSATMNFFSIFYFLFKSFVKVELSYVFTINLFTIAENCTEK